MSICPCGLGSSYDTCCGVFHHQNKKPQTAEQLMRSRYSAFVKKNIHYLIETHEPSTRALDLKESLKSTFESLEWLNLSILSTEAGLKNDREGKVHFKAQYLSNGQVNTLEENSQFIKKKKRWYYVNSIE